MLDTLVCHIPRLTLYRGLCYGPTIQKRRLRLKRGSHSLGFQAGKAVSQASNLHLPKFTTANASAVDTAQTV